MFENLTERLSHTFRNITGRGRLTEENIQDALRQVRIALLEADVALPVVKDFISRIQKQAIGQNVTESLTPGQVLIKIVNTELQQLMGEKSEGLDLACAPPAVILMAGLQGSGKTTTVAKLAKRLKEQEKRNILVTSADIYRPAAIQQLQTLAEQIGVDFYPSHRNEKPQDIAENAIAHAKKAGNDVVIVDTAGRLHIDTEMMDEIKAIHKAINPVETLFVVDSMTGQDAANTAKAFNDALPLTGVILTKTDGDARGGAALSIRYITEKPIKFIGIGEKVDGLEAFYPDRMASRILGMGDVLGFIEEAERKIDKKKAEKMAKKIKKGGFDLEDFRDQLLQMRNMGGMSSLLDKLPGLPAIPTDKVADKELIKCQAIIDSMTLQERRFPQIINGSRKRRIAKGSGTTPQDINRLMKQFMQMQKIMKKMSQKGGMKKMLQSMQAMMGKGGNFPPF